MVMKSKVVMIDPTLAAAWLAKNAQHNRPIRKTTVAGYAQQMRNGEWQLTHQGVAFDVNGVLMDGQHRLAAIVQAGVIVPMMVTVNAPSASFESLDCGIKRTVADRLTMDARVVAVLCQAIQIGRGDDGRVAERAVQNLSMTKFGQYAQDLVDAHTIRRARFSSAPVLIAAVVACVEGEDFDWVVEQRRALVAWDQNPETAAMAYFRRRFKDHRISGRVSGNLDVVACALHVFNSTPMTSARIQLSDGWQSRLKARVNAAMNYGNENN